MMALRDGTFAPFQAVVCCVYDLICDRVKTINLTGPLNILLWTSLVLCQAQAGLFVPFSSRERQIVVWDILLRKFDVSQYVAKVISPKHLSLSSCIVLAIVGTSCSAVHTNRSFHADLVAHREQYRLCFRYILLVVRSMYWRILFVEGDVASSPLWIIFVNSSTKTKVTNLKACIH